MFSALGGPPMGLRGVSHSVSTFPISAGPGQQWTPDLGLPPSRRPLSSGRSPVELRTRCPTPAPSAPQLPATAGPLDHTTPHQGHGGAVTR